MLLEILEKVYGRTKSGKLSHHAIKFCEKYNLNIEGDNSYEELIVAFSMLSNKEKRELALRMLVQSQPKNEERNTDLLELRKMSYKEACRVYHPDNKDTGDNGIFQFIQEVKCAFWDCNGKPRKEIDYYDWEAERYTNENPMWILRGKPKL